IIEDETSDANIYQRFDRKPGIQDILTALVTELEDEPALIAFFVDVTAEPPEPMDHLERTLTCLTRQLCGDVMGGPCVYGAEVDAPAIEPGVASDNQCRNMADTHDGVMSSLGDSIDAGIFDDFIDAVDRALIA